MPLGPVGHPGTRGERPIGVGDVVRFKAGSPSCLVVDVEGDIIWLGYLGPNRKPYEDWAPRDALVRILEPLRPKPRR